MGCCASKKPLTAAESPPRPSHPPPSVHQPLRQPLPPPVQTQLPTVENCINFFQTIKKEADIDYLVDLIDEKLQSLLNRSSTSSEPVSCTLKGRENSVWSSLIQSGSIFLEVLNMNIQLEKGDEVRRQDLARRLDDVGKVHWVFGGLSTIAFLLGEIGQVSENQSECIELLSEMVKLAAYIKLLSYDKPNEEKILRKAIIMIIEGSMMCASQLKSRKLFSFLKDSVDSISLIALQSRINQLLLGLKPEQSIVFPPWKPIHPDYAVGIQKQKQQVIKLLDMETDKKSSLGVVIHGFGGIGKTTLATAVIADLDLTDYNYSGVEIKENRSRNNIICMQEQILKDAFPAYTYDRNATLRNSTDGRDHLISAFQANGNKPVFLFIDNAFRAEDLKDLFPKRLAGLPMGSRIVITTRNSGVMDMLKDVGLACREHRVGALPQQEATKILLRDFSPDNTRHKENVRKALQICAGIPLVLEIVGAHLRKHNYIGDRCTQIFESLERVNVEILSQRAVTFLCNELDQSTKEAFLDICCFFFNWSRRDVEYIVGAEEVTRLEEAALFKTSNKNKVIVHDVIQAEGLSMSESSRIMDMQSWLEVAGNNQRLGQIKGVWLSGKDFESGYELDEKHIVSMRKNLRVLALGNKINVSRSNQRTPKFNELRFLCLGGDISALWPQNLESLEELAVFHGPVFKDGVTLYQLPMKLRVMKATAQSRESTNSQRSRPANVIPNSSLEELDLKELKSFQTLPEQLDHLNGLKVLILDEWDKMQELSEQVNELHSLCKLSICGGNSLKSLPKSFGQLSSLEVLILTSCKQLEELPSSFGDLSSLKKLNLAECANIKELPSSFGRLSSLEVSNLEKCWKLEALPSSFGKLSQLKKLSLQSDELKELPSSFGKLTSLEELKCNCLELKELPVTFGQLNSLTNLDLSCCVKLKTLPSTVGELRSLKVFSLFSCFRLEDLPSQIGELSCLTHLDLRQCHSLRERPKFSCPRRRHQSIWLPDHLMDRNSSSSN
ncbi:disease resistance protein RUN1 [Cryptomeria japonica]|uniref:disease resistance protein RUN1 n=1 Tax=Cryptomeria japonica TaxID=3369 RepID=UPI0027DA977C|nr:disease resistance protein RUN1 [Cryptomeria japonica]